MIDGRLKMRNDSLVSHRLDTTRSIGQVVSVVLSRVKVPSFHHIICLASHRRLCSLAETLAEAGNNSTDCRQDHRLAGIGWASGQTRSV